MAENQQDNIRSLDEISAELKANPVTPQTLAQAIEDLVDHLKQQDIARLSNAVSQLGQFISNFDRYVDLKLDPAVEALRGEIEALRTDLAPIRDWFNSSISDHGGTLRTQTLETQVVDTDVLTVNGVVLAGNGQLTISVPLKVESESTPALLLNIGRTKWELGARSWQRPDGSEVHYLELGAVDGERPLTLSSDSDLYVEGSIGVHGNAHVDGDMSVIGSVSVDGSVFVEGMVHDEQGH